jgi:hypothetical protein
MDALCGNEHEDVRMRRAEFAERGDGWAAAPQFSISRLAMFVAHQAVISAPIIRVSVGDSPHLVPEDQPEAIAAG